MKKGIRHCGKSVWHQTFIWSEAQAPLEFLGSYNAISFGNPESLPIKNHELTTDDVRN